ncbi:CDP-glycerol glycerophosphotransferase family protein [Virgibacillus halodenitrificans]|uniref:CDP-glycerol glycerophosphotransferase family protein n=1 Tax=Virgibacillus halodenitrificans TaxID=1482 RepID=UPI00045D134F|nr:CDP-glycerol glycerophosphotransferase family protein [Virgibacillus halodenitrificans]CDQ31476.1 Putative CDP-glycerol:glycerophosphate glycerophosphotransferase [Virgibacillus halodenitrificans]
MFISSIDNKEAEIKLHAKVISGITKLNIYGPYFDIEGYATVEGIVTYEEDRIRKTLLIIPQIDFDSYRQTHSNCSGVNDELCVELSDDEILEKEMYQIPLSNCTLNEVQKKSELANGDQLSGFKGSIDLSTIKRETPLAAGEYDVYIKLEQMDKEKDHLKYEKIIPISAKKFLGNKLYTTKLHYFSTKKVLKYNLLITLDKYTKTLRFKNSLLQSYDPRELDEDSQKYEGKYVKAIKRRFFKLIYVLCCLMPIKRNKVVFASDSRAGLSGNFFFVYEELHKRNLDLDIKFLFSERINNKKSFFELMNIAFHFATSKIILLDDFYPLIYPLKIRDNADLIQVWHAAGAFKTFGFSRLGRPGGPSPKSKNHRNYTKVAVSSEGVRKNYAEGFGVPLENVFATGVARSDIFFDENYKTHVVETLHQKYPFLKNKKVILFAPTFRGNGQASAHYPFEVLNLRKIYEDLHEEYVFLFKIHPFVQNKLEIPYEFADFFYDLSEYREINDLLLITDLLITDYSSVCFEYALLNKPMLFFAYDVEKYIQERDFYYNYFDFIPGPLVKNTEDMLKVIAKQDFEIEKIPPFIQYFFGDTLGKAAKNVVDELIIPSLENNKKDIIEPEIKLPPPTSRIELFERSLKNEEKR